MASICRKRTGLGLALTTMLGVLPASLAASDAAPSESTPIAAFASALEALASDKDFPGLSAAIVRDQQLIWADGLGYADLEKNVPARADTPYRLASLSKPFAAVILMQLVEEERLDLDAPMRDFAIHAWFEPGGGSWAHYPSRYDERPITVRHVLTHTSEADPPGESYAYSGNIFGDLTWVIEDATRLPYPEVLRARILDPLKMSRTLPGQLVPWGKEIATDIATPYKLTAEGPVPATYPGFGLDPDIDVNAWNLDPGYRLPRETQDARRHLLGERFAPLYSGQSAAGLVSTVEDLARFDIALDRNELITEDSRRRMFTAARTSNGSPFPYGLGWFVEDYDGLRLVWHYGWFPPTISALYMKVPDRNLTLILLSNCDGLSAGVSWSDQGVRASPFARLFLDHFVSN